MKKRVVQSLSGVVVVYLILMGMMFSFQRSLMYFPQGNIPEEIAQRVLPKGQIVSVHTKDGLTLKSYLVPPQDKTRPILIAFHGNGGSAIGLSQNFAGLIKGGYGLMMAEYRGYDGNAGKASEEGLYQDAEAHLEFVLAQYPKNKIIGYGQSLGSAVAVDLVSRHGDQFSGLILEVPFDSVVNVVGRIYSFVPFPEIMVRDKYHSDQKIGTISLPKLFLIAGQDEVVGTEAGMTLYGLASEPKQIKVFENAGHMTVFDFGAAEVVEKFIEKEIWK